MQVPSFPPLRRPAGTRLVDRGRCSPCLFTTGTEWRTCNKPRPHSENIVTARAVREIALRRRFPCVPCVTSRTARLRGVQRLKQSVDSRLALSDCHASLAMTTVRARHLSRYEISIDTDLLGMFPAVKCRFGPVCAATRTNVRPSQRAGVCRRRGRSPPTRRANRTSGAAGGPSCCRRTTRTRCWARATRSCRSRRDG